MSVSTLGEALGENGRDTALREVAARIGEGASLAVEIEGQTATSDILSATNEMDSISGSKLVGSRIKLNPVRLEAHIVANDDCSIVAFIETLLTGL